MKSLARYLLLLVICLLAGCATTKQSTPLTQEVQFAKPNINYPTLILPHNGEVESVAFSPDGQYLTTASMNNTVQLWEISTGLQVWESQHDGSALSVAFSPDGTFVLSGGLDNKVRIWNAKDGTLVKVLQHQAEVSAVAISPNGQAAASGDNSGEIVIWNTSNWTERFRINLAESNIPSELRGVNLSFSPNGSMLVASSGYQTDDLEAWNIQTSQRLWRTQIYNLRSLTYSPDGNMILAGGIEQNQGYITFFDALSGDTIRFYRHNSGRAPSGG